MLYVCNHLGLVDALLIASQMPVAFAAKAEMHSWPLLGWVGRTMGIIFVERERPTRTSVFVRAVQERLRHGVSVVVFPEGTTGWGDAVRRFKTGAFEAVAEEVRGGVLPLYLKVKAVEGQPAGNRALAWVDESLQANAWRLLGLKHVDVELRVGAPLATAGRDRKELARRAHAAVSRLASSSPDADGPDVRREHPASPRNPGREPVITPVKQDGGERKRMEDRRSGIGYRESDPGLRRSWVNHRSTHSAFRIPKRPRDSRSSILDIPAAVRRPPSVVLGALHGYRTT